MTSQPDYSDRLRKGGWEVRPVALAVAQAMVERLHYAKGGSNTAIVVHGLSEQGRLVAPKSGPKNRTKAEMEALGHTMIGRHAKHKFVHVVGDGTVKRVERQAALL